MPTIEFGGKSFTVDEDGFIDDYTNWSQEWVQYVKKEEGIEELNDEHTKVVEVLRERKERHRPHGPRAIQGDRLQTETHL